MKVGENDGLRSQGDPTTGSLTIIPVKVTWFSGLVIDTHFQAITLFCFPLGRKNSDVGR